MFNEKNIHWLKICALFTGYLLFCLIFKSGGVFYEDGAYKAYLVSMTEDLDFNIINQVSREKAWLAAESFFHPDFHYEIYSALLFIVSLLETLTFRLINFSQHPFFTYTLAGFTLNFFCLFSGLHLTKKAGNLIGIKVRTSDFMLFLFGTTMFFFSFFYTTVPEILAFPSSAYLLCAYFQLKIRKAENLSFFLIGMNAAYLLTQKSTMWIFPAYLIGRILMSKWKELNWRQYTGLLLPVILLIVAKYINIYLKYGDIRDPTTIIFEYYTDPNLLNVAWKVVKNFFPFKGTFFVSPILIICLVSSFLVMIRLFKQKIFSSIDLILFVIWMVLGESMHALVIGDLGENHIPGRLILSSAPFFIIALSKLLQDERYRKLGIPLTCALSFWSVVMTFGYILIDNVDTYLYGKFYFPKGNVLLRAWNNYSQEIMQNLGHLKNILFPVFAYIIIIAVVSFGFRRLRSEKAWHAFLGLALSVFIIMTTLNLSYHQSNIEKMKANGFYQGKVIGNGPEIYSIDYILDYFKSLRNQTTDPVVKATIDDRIERFYQEISKQVIVSTPEFDEAMRTRSTEFSFWIREGKK